jgi:hypothetical protein
LYLIFYDSFEAWRRAGLGGKRQEAQPGGTLARYNVARAQALK